MSENVTSKIPDIYLTARESGGFEHGKPASVYKRWPALFIPEAKKSWRSESVKQQSGTADRDQQPLVPHVKPPEGAPSEDEDDLAAKTESCFLVFFPPQWGQTCFFDASERETSLSKFRPQSLHLNS